MSAVRQTWDAWTGYAALAVCLAPVLVPPGPGRTALLDPFNVAAIGIFAVAALASRGRVRVPLLGPVILISLGSLIATANAVRPDAALLTLLQDAYLFAWFVVLVNVLSERGDLFGLRRMWAIAGAAIAIFAIATVVLRGESSLGAMLNPKGFRAMGTFDQPDELADYMVMSIFMTLSLNEESGRWLRWGAIGLMLAAIAATKANGGVLSLAAGLVAWALVRAWTREASVAGLVATGLLGVSVVLVAVWLVGGLGLGSAQLNTLQSSSILGRMSHSSEGREKIWSSLRRRYERNVLGIGPGNSRWQTVTVEERERPIAGHLETFDSGADPFLSKESHNDYIAYLIERGPLALVGMLLLRLQVFRDILKWWGRRGGSSRSRATGGAMAAALFGAWVASCFNSNTIETLHFRHVWLFLAMVCALGSSLGESHRDRARDAFGAGVAEATA